MVYLSDELEELKRFHGHLGPYAVIGFRMGLLARERFPERIFAILHSGTKRPLSCLADGVQFSSCCTLGKNNIALRDDNEARAEFSDGHANLEIETKGGLRERIDATTTHQNEELIALDLYTAPIEEIFTITEGRSAPFGIAGK
jgi:formylmethanofuran dehydrogenase subunit E